MWRRHINKLRGSKRDGDSRLAIFFTILRENHNEIYLFAREREYIDEFGTRKVLTKATEM